MTLEIVPPLADLLQRVARKLHLKEDGYTNLLISVLDAVLQEEGDAPAGETELLSAATQGFPPEWWQQYARLVAERESGTILPNALRALQEMTEAAEERHAARLEAVAALARLRSVEPRRLLHELGLAPVNLTAA